MSTSCKFMLDRWNAAYFSGEIISGTIILNTAKDKNVNNVCIVFLGEGKVKWDESESTTNSDGSTSTNTTYYTAHNVYIKSETRVHGSGFFPKGQYTYTFNIQLPLECPTSCEAKYGHIRYTISLVVDRPYRFNNVFQKPISVIQNIDLNTNPVFRIPVIAEEIGFTSCCSCSHGRLVYTLRIPYGAYAPGQLVEYTLQVDNQSMVDTQGYSLTFIQKHIFIAHSPSRREYSTKLKLLEQKFGDKCLRLSNRMYEGQFRIPPVTACTFDPNAIIKFEYKLKVTVHMPGCNSNTHLRIPICIGTIPIRENAVETATEATAPDMVVDGKHLTPNDIPPPSFEEAVRCDSPFVDHDVDERHRVVNFRPLYPIYRK